MSVINYGVFALLRICQIECSLSDVKNRRYAWKPPLLLPVGESTREGIEQAAEAAVRLEQGERIRRAEVDDKTKWLFGLASILLTLTGALLPKAIGRAGVLCGMASVVLLAIVALLSIWYFGINNRSVPVIDGALMRAENEPAAQYVVMEGILTANAWNERVTDFHVDVYRAACRLVALGLVLVAATALFAVGHRRQAAGRNTEQSQVVSTGPTGRPGPVGSVGPAGPRGARGPVGSPRVRPPCECACVPCSSRTPR